MFLHDISANDPRFKTLRFHAGMNMLLAETTEESSSSDSRNGAGKSSFVRILRYLLGGDVDKNNPLSHQALEGFIFTAGISLDDEHVSRVERPTVPKTVMDINGRRVKPEEWREQIGESIGLSGDFARPTPGQIIGQFVRTYFQDSTKTFPVEPHWQSGVRIGYLLGLSPSILNKTGEIYALGQNKKALRKAVREGALPGVDLNVAELRARLVSMRSRRAQMDEQLRRFTVDEQYESHQIEANLLTSQIKDLNSREFTLAQRRREITNAIAEESRDTPPAAEMERTVAAAYEETGILLPDLLLRRYEEVEEFHESVVRNRRLYLEAELNSVEDGIREVQGQRKQCDERRARVMGLLDESMALEAFRSAEQDVLEMDAQIVRLEHDLELAQSLENNDMKLKSRKAEAQLDVKTEISELQEPIDKAIGMFADLGREIYSDREATLAIDANSKGELTVIPKIDGDASEGISQVKTFLLDMVCLTAGIRHRRAPRILVHDSTLFDSMDDRQIASCLNIGARLADEYRFQYIVTLNSDRLQSVEDTGNFERRNYPIMPILTDQGENGGLFGFRFD